MSRKRSPVLPQVEVGVDDRLDGVDDLVGGEGRADDVAERRGLGGGAAERDLVELLALLVDAEDADVADVVMAAGVDAAGDLDLQLADVVLTRSRSAKRSAISWAIGIERALARRSSRGRGRR